MSGTYSIVSKVDHPSKFACYVKFNEDLDPSFYSTEKYPNGGEYWECDSLVASEIDTALQAAADAEADALSSEEAVKTSQDAVGVVDGKIVVPEEAAEEAL